VSGELTAGFVDSEGEVHTTFVVSEMTGVEEDILAGKGDMMPRLNQVIYNCTQSIGSIMEKAGLSPAVKALTSIDRMLMLISIRRASLGDDYMVQVTCPDCSESSTHTIDLSGLETTQIANPNSREIVSTLDSGRAIKWHVMNGDDEAWLQRHGKRGKDLLSLAMLARVDAIDEDVLDRRSNVKGAVSALQKLRMSERNQLRGIFIEEEGSIDTDIDFSCPDCGSEFTSDLDPGQTSFFFPSLT
jgi:hypothetical protein